MAHFAGGRQLTKGTSNDVLEHARRPDRLHHERGHEHVAAEVRREVREPCHELLARAHQLESAHLTLEPAIAKRSGGISGGALRLQKLPEVGVEQLLTPDRRERTGAGGDADREVDRRTASRANDDAARPHLNVCRQSADAKLERQVRPSVEGGLLDGDDPAGVDLRPRDGGAHSRAQLAHVGGAQQLEVTLSLLVIEPRDMRDERVELRSRKGRRVERTEMPPLILKIPLDAH